MRKTVLSTAVLAALLTPLGAVYAAENDASQKADEEETILVVGSRSQKTRSLADSPVPVDLISGSELTDMGNTSDLTDNLKALVPSYTATPATGDGSAFVRPTSLRGTAPDQTLILVNGKRRHRSALVQFFAPAAGNGAQGVDIGMIPSIAVKRVEVLRDGAASQYGSDAIAGVINFVMKDASDGGEAQVQYGQFYEGESSTKLAVNKGIALSEKGFANFSLEYTDNEALSRGLIRPDAQALLDAGVQGVGADSPFGDAPFTQTWGRPETSGLRLYLNSGMEFGDGKNFYARVGYANTDGRYRFFYRNPNHSTIATLVGLGYTGNLTQVGYTPYLDGSQTDLSISTGVDGEFSNGTYFDFSFGYGSNKLDYFLNNTTNPSLGLNADLTIPQRDFDVGGYKQEETIINADFSKLMTDTINLAYGAEYHKESYTAIAGEPNSYLGSGSNGFGGIKPQDAGKFSRDNYAVYADVEQDISKDFMIQYAARYEDFSDFGGTLNGKIAARYSVNDSTNIRGAVSTGFHAPTPGQANVRTTITTFDGVTGLQVEEGLVPSTDPRVAAVGGKELREETSTNISLGFTSEVSDKTTLTVDFYQIKVDHRIYRTGDIAVPNTTNTISFYTNALNIRHRGVDVVLTSDLEWNDEVATDVSFAYSYNKVDVLSQDQVNGVNPVNDGLVEDIENNYPNHRFVLTTNTPFTDQWNFMARVNFYGESWDERGRLYDPVSPSALIDHVVFVDLELSYQATENLKIKLGGSNVFDSFPDKIGPPNANRLSVGLQYPRR
ncbi:MAG TPA: hypothetical protein ENJ60_13755, partial [Aeromonadales bacterium]|nr:hypothetical protein [Aeromonadales bacterium]